MIAAFAAVLLLFSGSAAHAQLQTGNLFGTVVGDQGEALPGVTVTLSGSGAPQIEVTDSQGQFRFLGLGSDSYQLNAALEGFSPIDYPNLVIAVGRSTTLEVVLSSQAEDTTKVK
jgi:hypothetical protein